MEFYQYFYSDLKDHFWLSPIKEYKNNIIKINNALSLFQEEKSSKLFIDIIHFRLTQDIKYSPQPQKTVQYFDKEIFNLDKTMKLIDCGAFDGDSLRELSGIIGKIDKIAAFEPDTKNFSKLAEMVKNIESGFANEVYLWPCGVWSKSEKLYFSEGQGEASGILANKAGANVISCVGIDEVLLGFKPNFIKMDIEGAEYQALLGAKNTILENTPNLAICIYHKPDDLWELPLLIHQWNPDYKLYLRPYAYSTFDLVLLAVK
jgi:FkbM family methyltransferase